MNFSSSIIWAIFDSCPYRTSISFRAVVLEGGLWFVWRRKTDWDKYEKNLDQAITNLKRIRKKLNVRMRQNHQQE